MSYSHIRASVPQIENTTTQRHPEYATFKPEECKGSVLHEGIAYERAFFEFALAVLAKFPGAKLGVNVNCDREWVTGAVSCMNHHVEAWIYFPHQLFAMGKLGRRVYMNSKDGHAKYMYGVYARTIENERFRDGNDCYNMRMSAEFAPAVKHALKYLRPYSVDETIKHSAGGVINGLVATRHKVRQNASDAYGEVTGSVTTLRREFAALLQSGYEFVTPGYGEKVRKWIDELAAREAMEARPVHAYFVQVRTVGEQQEATCTEVFNLLTPIRQLGTTTKCAMQDLPEDLMGKVAVLMMAQSGEVIEGVGQRVAEGTFWLLRGEA